MTRRNAPELERLGARWSAALERAEPPFDEAASEARWLSAFQAAEPGKSPRRRSPHLLWLAAAATLLLVLGAGVLIPRLGSRVGPQAGAWLETAPGKPQPLVFGDGSRVEVDGASRVRVASVDPFGARIVLEAGTVRATVVHRNDTHWAFEGGPFVVRVTGTELVVRWRPEVQDFEVAVTTGSVWVTGPMLEGGRSVTAGQRCRVRVGEARLEVTPIASAAAAADSASVGLAELPVEPAASAPSAAVALPPAPGPPAPGAAPPRFTELERAGKYRDALAAAERAGLDAILAGGSSGELMSLERAARLGGRPDLASRALVACRSRFAGSADAATAAYLLGRAAPPAAAARWFETHLAEQPGGSLAREASGRLIESYQRAGASSAARAAAERYLARYPEGPHAPFARSVLGVVDDPG